MFGSHKLLYCTSGNIITLYVNYIEINFLKRKNNKENVKYSHSSQLSRRRDRAPHVSVNYLAISSPGAQFGKKWAKGSLTGEQADRHCPDE